MAKHKRGASRPFSFCTVSLGCPKNTVDSTSMAVLLQRAGYESTARIDTADFVIVNTCGFIEPAREESLATLRDLADVMREDQYLIAAGCWAQREPGVLLDAVPELSAVIGTRSWSGIIDIVENIRQDASLVYQLVEDDAMQMPEIARAPGYALDGRSAFLKIADGCSRRCAFCAIPGIKGDAVSRDLRAILADTRELESMGVQEINLIAQDATFYGYDLGMRDGLADLLKQMLAAAPNIPWLRILYAFPGFVTPKLVDVMAAQSRILPYIDIPLQHAHPDILKRMQRPSDMDEVRNTLKRLRDAMPEIALRTTMIVGFPGETENEFKTLLSFIEEAQFDRLGAFTYSQEVGTAAAKLADDVPEELKQERLERLMLTQQGISLRKNQAWIGKKLRVLTEAVEEGQTSARSFRDAPEIDGVVWIPGQLSVGQFVDVEIVDAEQYDLIARLV